MKDLTIHFQIKTKHQTSSTKSKKSMSGRECELFWWGVESESLLVWSEVCRAVFFGTVRSEDSHGRRMYKAGCLEKFTCTGLRTSRAGLGDIAVLQ